NTRVSLQHIPAQIQAPPPTQNGHVLDAEPEELDADTNEQTASAPAASGATSKPRKPYTFMSEFNLAPAGVPSRKDYCNGKGPVNHGTGRTQAGRSRAC